MHSSWSTLLFENFVVSELAKKLEWRDLIAARSVNKEWRELFSSNNVWKQFCELEFPFESFLESENNFNKFTILYTKFNEFDCEHKNAAKKYGIRVCPCHPFTDIQIAKHYTGFCNDYVFCCDEDQCECSKKIATKEYLKFPLLCRECGQEFSSEISEIKGLPQRKYKWTNKKWYYKEINSLDPLTSAIAIPNTDQYVAITETKDLVLLKFDEDILESSTLQSEVKGDRLTISEDGVFVAVYEYLGIHGFVYNLKSKQITFQFQRDDYYQNQCPFPISFIVYDSKTLLVAAKLYNYLEVYDPETGVAIRNKTENDPETSFDYFWCALHFSPNYKYGCSSGWVWHPVGFVSFFSIESLLKKDSYEPPKLSLEAYDWNYPICWLDDSTFAIWGESNSNQEAVSILKAYNVVTGQYTDLAVSQVEDYSLVYDDYLYSLNSKGIEAIDVTNSVVLEIENIQPVGKVFCYNKHTKQFLSKNDNILILSTIVDK